MKMRVADIKWVHRKAMTFIALIAVAAVLSACGKKKENNNSNPGGAPPPPPVNSGPPVIYPPGVNGGPAGTISGVIQGDSSCSSSSLQVRVMIGSQSVYEIPVPFNGTFSFQLVGNQSYTLRVEGNNNCFAQQIVFVPSNQTVQVTLNLSKTGWWGGGGGWGGGGWGGGAPYPPPGYAPYTPPYIYGNMPCYWNQYGCHGNFYPGWCGAVFGKPMVYLDAPIDSPFEVELGFKSNDKCPELNSQQYVLSPVAHMAGRSEDRTLVRWAGEVKQADRKQGKFLAVGKAKYSHLIYDVGVDTSQSSEKDGIFLGCEKPIHAIQLMTGYLKSKGFQKSERLDFKNHWEKKSFPNEKICVYVVDSRKIDDFVRIKAVANGKPITSIKRVWFLIQMATLQGTTRERQAKLDLLPPKFVLPGVGQKNGISAGEAQRLIALGTASSLEEESGAQRALSSDSAGEIREWGVGFLIERKRDLSKMSPGCLGQGRF